MRWLEQRRRERRWWVASASLAVMSLVLGVLGVVPVFADVSAASCVISSDANELEVSWTGVPAGMELTLLAETSNGRLRIVATGNVDNVVGYGDSGSWTGSAYPRAVRYSLYSDPAGGGGSIACVPAAAAGTRIDVHNGVGATNPGFGTGSCPADPDGREFGWHFVLTGSSSSFVSLDVVFASAGAVTDFVSDPTPKHAYVYTAGPDTIVSASASIDGPADTRLVLSHVCSPVAAATPLPTSTAVPTATSTVPTAKPTVTVTSTVTPVPTATSTAVPTATPTPEPTATAVPTVTSTVTPEPTATAVPTAKPTVTATSTVTPAPSATSTAVPTATPKPKPDPNIAATVDVECETNVFVATVNNTGGGSGVVEFYLDDVLVDALAVSGGSSVTVTEPVPQGTATFAVVTERATVASTTVSDPCAVAQAQLQAEVSLDCGSDTIAVTVSNTGTAAGVAEITVNGVERTVDVASGASEHVAFDRPAGTTEADIVVRSGDRVILRQIVDTSCTVPGPTLAASVNVVCKLDIALATVSVVNTGDLAGVATVTAGETPDTIEVSAGTSEQRSYRLAGTGTISVSVSHQDAVLAAYEVTDVCETATPELSAEETLRCELGKVEVLVWNSGTADGVAHVEVNGVTTLLDVPAGGTAWHVTSVGVGQANRVIVHDGTLSILDVTYETTCSAPEADLAATVAIDCSAGSLLVEIMNSGDLAGAAALVLDDVEQAMFVVDAGATVTHTVGIDPTRSHTFTVLAHDEQATALVTETFGACATPEADISAVSLLNCESGSIIVTLENVGDAPGSAMVTINATVEMVVLPAGTAVKRTAPLVIGGATVVRVAVGDVVLVDERVDDTCSIPEAEIVASTVLDCANDQIVVRLQNGGAVAGDATVVINGSAQTVTVPAETTVAVSAALSVDGDHLVDVSVDGSSILTEQATGGCAVPEGSMLASIEISCTQSQANITISNGLSSDASVVLSVGGVDETVAVPSGEVVVRAAPLTEDDVYEIAVHADGGLLLAFSSGTFDCKNAEVKARTKINEPDEPAKLKALPRTGATSTAMLATAGVAFVLTGAVALKASSVRRERLAEAT